MDTPLLGELIGYLDLAWVVLRDAVPVGLVLARHDGSGTARIDLDDVTPERRDFKAGTTLFDRCPVFAADGISEMVASADTEVHRRYLQRMGSPHPEPRRPGGARSADEEHGPGRTDEPALCDAAVGFEPFEL